MYFMLKKSFAILFVFVALTAAQGPMRLGPEPGSRAPEFTLQDQSGRKQSVASLMGRNGLVLVFFRSADW